MGVGWVGGGGEAACGGLRGRARIVLRRAPAQKASRAATGPMAAARNDGTRQRVSQGAVLTRTTARGATSCCEGNAWRTVKRGVTRDDGGLGHRRNAHMHMRPSRPALHRLHTTMAVLKTTTLLSDLLYTYLRVRSQ